MCMIHFYLEMLLVILYLINQNTGFELELFINPFVCIELRSTLYNTFPLNKSGFFYIYIFLILRVCIGVWLPPRNYRTAIIINLTVLTRNKKKKRRERRKEEMGRTKWISLKDGKGENKQREKKGKRSVFLNWWRYKLMYVGSFTVMAAVVWSGIKLRVAPSGREFGETDVKLQHLSKRCFLMLKT